MHKKTLLFPALLTLGCLGASSAHADSGWYSGGGIGLSKSNIEAAVDEGALDAAVTKFETDDSDMGWKIFGGYRFNDLLGVELAYIDLGEQSVTNSGTTELGPIEVSAGAETDGFSLSALAHFGITPLIGVYARAGIYRWDTDIKALVSALGSISSVTESDDGTDVVFGLGADMEFGPVGARLEWERFNDLSDTDFNLYSVSVYYQF